MPSLSPEQYRTAAPYIELAERLGRLAAHLLTGNPHAVTITRCGSGADTNTNLLRNAGLAGVLSRSATAANVVNAMQLAADRGWKVAEVHDTGSGESTALRVDVETDLGVTTVEGNVVQGKPRLMRVDGIYCEAPLSGTLVCMKSLDLPGVIGHIGTLLGSNAINIANFSLGRRESGEPAEAISILSTDSLVPEDVLAQLLSNPAVKLARSVAL
jgi:D-3-phosphoglycerate dehydrogenase